MATVQIQFNIAQGVWDDFVATQPGATTAEQTLAAKGAIKDQFIKPAVLAYRTRQKQEELNAVLREYVATQEARLLD